MIIVKYFHHGGKWVQKEEADSGDLEKLHKYWEEQAENDDTFHVDWLDEESFEVTNDNWASGFIYRLRPDDWPIINGEPQ